jgi:hypothetical protein
MIKKLIPILLLLSLVGMQNVKAQEGTHDCGDYQYCFDWEDAEYIDDYGTYCDDLACAYPPKSSACFLSAAQIFGTWCAYPRDDYSQSDTQPNTSPLPIVWTAPPPPEGFGEDDETSAAIPTPVPPPPDVQCPPESVEEAEIHVTGELVDPPYPVVVGQDPNKRGADLLWQVEITPVVYTWFEKTEVIEEKICRYVGEGNGSGCPGPESEYSQVLGSNGGWKPWMADNDAWLEEGGVSQIECIEHVEVYPVQLSWVRTYANLSEESRDWIEHGGLQQRYPGAHLYQPDWEWLPPLFGNVLNNGVYVWEWIEKDIQFRDPGQYGMSVNGAITGTPVTGPRVFNMEASGFSVWLYEATLTQ